ncbi:unnamed protein product, partial [Choristocarpus tenellus]
MVRPKYGFKGMPSVVCGAHKVAGMVSTVNGKVVVATRNGRGCAKAGGSSPKSEAGNNKPGDKKRTSGSITKKTTRRQICEHHGCTTQASYGLAGTQRPIFCSTHKEEDMVGLKNRPCMYPGCDVRPHYGREGCRAEYCANHKEDYMVHVKVTSRNRQLNASREKESIVENSGEGNREGGEQRKVKQSKKEGDANVDAHGTGIREVEEVVPGNVAIKRGRGRPKKVAVTALVSGMTSSTKDSSPTASRGTSACAAAKRKTGEAGDGSSSPIGQLNAKEDWDRDGVSERDGKDQMEDCGGKDWEGEESRVFSVSRGSQVGIRPGKRNIKLSRKARAAAGVDEPSGPQRMTKDMRIREKEKIAAAASWQRGNKRKIQQLDGG